MRTFQKIELCPDCQGEGERTWSESLPGHNLEVVEHCEPCATCNTTGRVIRKKRTDLIIAWKPKDGT